MGMPKPKENSGYEPSWLMDAIDQEELRKFISKEIVRQGYSIDMFAKEAKILKETVARFVTGNGFGQGRVERRMLKTLGYRNQIVPA